MAPGTEALRARGRITQRHAIYRGAFLNGALLVPQLSHDLVNEAQIHVLTGLSFRLRI
jgi:hypothetical protein